MIFLSAIFAVCLFSGAAEAQIQFERAIGSTGMEQAYSIIQSPDSGYVMAGYTSHLGAGGEDMYFVKFDRYGNLQWDRTIGGTGDERAWSIVSASGGGYIAAGETNSFGLPTNSNVYIVKLDTGGNLLWSKIIYMAGFSVGLAYSIIKTTDGGYAVTGVAGPGWETKHCFFLKLDTSGNVTWCKFASGFKGDGESIIQTSDGGYAVAGSSLVSGTNNFDMLILKLDAVGSIQWSRTVGGANLDIGNSIIQTTDGGYAIAGSTTSFGLNAYNAYVVKLNAAGNLQWTRTMGLPNMGGDGGSIIQTSDGQYTLFGTTSINSWQKMYVVRLDANSNLLWSKTIDDPVNAPIFFDYGAGIIKTNDGGYAVCGTTSHFGAGQSGDMYIVKFNQNWSTCAITTSRQSIVGTGGIIGSPNPIVTGATVTVASVSSSAGGGGILTEICIKFPLLPKPIILGLISQVQTFINNGMLNEENGHSLLIRLDAAVRSIDHGHNEAAIDHLESFNNRIDYFIDSGRLTEDQGRPLINSANDAIRQLGGGESKPKQEVTKDFLLEQNYPNPFNPSTNIRFQIPTDGNVTLRIYDILGREVVTLVNEKLTAGEHEVMFDASKLASGVYLYRIEAGNYTDIKKMLLIK